MATILEAQLENMQRLMNYGYEGKKKVNESSTVEYHEKGADGKTYGIIREGAKYYVKVAPAKDTEVLAEDYDYLGGIGGKKQCEYLSYASAYKNLGMQMKSLNEAYERENRMKEMSQKKYTQADWQINETKEMRAEIERFNEITQNCDYILSESKEGKPFTMNHTLPEAPATNPSEEKTNTPFTKVATAKGDKDMKETESNPEKAGFPFTGDKGGENGEVFTEKPQYVDTGVAGAKPKGGKVVRVTESQVLAWNDSMNYMDTSKGTEIGSSEPFTEEIPDEEKNQGDKVEAIHEAEDIAVHNTDNQNSPTPGTNEPGDGTPFEEKVTEVNEEAVPIEDVEGFEEEVPFPEVEDDGAYASFERDFNDWENANEPESFELVFGDDEGEKDFDSLSDRQINHFESVEKNNADRIIESTINAYMNKKLDEATLDVFGKHPAYQKAPMTTPPNKEIDRFGRDWNDKSAKGEQPFGTQIGDGTPFDEEVIDMLTDAIVNKLQRNKKKVN